MNDGPDKPEDYVQDMLDEIARIERFAKDVKNAGEFKRDEKTLYACFRCLEVIGEAAKHVPTDFRNRHKEIGWKDIAGMRDKLIHDYGGIDYSVVWETIQTDIPTLKKQLEKIVKEFGSLRSDS
ncbi:MAG: DUF86 domain-containing protein [Candidatus Micrarchaeota archaeon]